MSDRNPDPAEDASEENTSDNPENGDTFDMNVGSRESVIMQTDIPQEEGKEQVPYLVEMIRDVRMAFSNTVEPLLAEEHDFLVPDAQFGMVGTTPSEAAMQKMEDGGDTDLLEVVLLRVFVENPEENESKLNEIDEVVDFYRDTAGIEPFESEEAVEGQESASSFGEGQESSDDPFEWAMTSGGGYPSSIIGSIHEGSDKTSVAEYLGVDEIHQEGFEGDGIVVGIIDGGITARSKNDRINSYDITHSQSPIRGRPDKLIENVIGGSQKDWGTTGSPDTWGWHGCMCATDVLAMAPRATLYDMRLDGRPTFASSLIRTIDWAITKHKQDGTPHILNISAGLYRKSIDPDLAENVNHPATRKVVEAMNEGIICLFAAGNCGQESPHPNCTRGSESNVGRNDSILGVNGHQRVISVGGATVEDRRAGYSSQGKSLLYQEGIKPDVVAPTHFEGFFAHQNRPDSGTSAATPITAGVVALLKEGAEEKGKALEQDEARKLLKRTAKAIEESTPNVDTGYGMINAKAAFDDIMERDDTASPLPGDDSTDKPTITSPGTWSSEKRITRNPSHTPGVTSSGSGNIDLFLFNRSGALGQKKYRNEAWEDTNPVGTNLAYSSAPAAAHRDSNTFDVTALGPDQRLYHLTVKNGEPDGEWTDLNSGRCSFSPAIVTRDSNTLEVYVVREEANHLYRKRFEDGAWSDEWEQLGGVCTSAPTAVARDNQVDVFVRGADGKAYWRQNVNDQWSNYTGLGEMVIVNGLNATRRDRNHMDLFTVGPEGNLYRKTHLVNAWGEWENLGKISIRPPAAVSPDPDRIDLFFVSPPRENDPDTYLNQMTWSSTE